jgi:hypothetical protein
MPITSMCFLIDSVLWTINVLILSYFHMCFIFLELWMNLLRCDFQNHKSLQVHQTKDDWSSKAKAHHDRDHLDNMIAQTKPVNTSVLSSMCNMGLHFITCCRPLCGRDLCQCVFTLLYDSFSLFYKDGLKSFSSSWIKKEGREGDI